MSDEVRRDRSVHLLDHPVARSTVSAIRVGSISGAEMRAELRRISFLLAVEATRALAETQRDVETPLGLTAHGSRLANKAMAVPILRAGLGMLDGFFDLMPECEVGFVGTARDEETLLPTVYYANIPPTDGVDVFLLDPMLATGGSASTALSFLEESGYASLSLLCIIASPEGVDTIASRFPDVALHVAAIDDGLDHRGYIVPGLGDAGDRLWGTGVRRKW